MSGGYLVKFTTKDGKTQKGRVMNADQKDSLLKLHKYLVRLIDDNYKDQVDKDGKKELSVIHWDKLTVFGYVD